MTTLNPAVGENAYTITLATLRARMLRRLGYAAQVASPPASVSALVDEFLQDAQTQLAKQYPTIVTDRFYEWTMVAGTRFYSVSGDDEGSTSPDNVLDTDTIEWVGIEDLNGAFTPLIEGIDPTFYTLISQQGRPTHYEIRQSIEVMPAPDQAYSLWIKGHTKNYTFTGDSDVTTIDPEAVFLLALANAKAHYGQPDARNISAQATNYIGNLVAGQHGTRRYVPGAKPRPPQPKPTMV